MNSIALFILLIASQSVSALQDLPHSYQEGKAFSQSKTRDASSAAKTTDPYSVPGFKTAHPPETSYRESDIKKLSAQQLPYHESGKFVKESFQGRPIVIIDRKNDLTLNGSTQVIADAKNIATGNSAACQKARNECHIIYHQEICYESLHSKASSEIGCAALRTKGCDQIDSQCQTRSPNGECSLHQQIFRCPVTTCPPNMNVVCGDTNSFCITGDCTTGNYIPSPDFNKAIAELSGVATASKDFNMNFIFSGQHKDCRKDVVDFSNCCADSGWGHDIGLAQDCNQEEQDLGRAKEAHLCHEIGTYCSKKILGVCTEHSKSYCCFNSKLAKLIQKQGRLQLGKSWGKPKHPNCHGFSPEELQHIDFSKLDLSDIYSDIQNKQRLPNTAETQQRISEKVKQFYKQNNSP